MRVRVPPLVVAGCGDWCRCRFGLGKMPNAGVKKSRQGGRCNHFGCMHIGSGDGMPLRFYRQRELLLCHEVGGGEIVQQKSTKNDLSIDVDEQHVAKWVLVSRRATTAALCHRVTSSASRPRRGDAALRRVLDKNHERATQKTRGQ